ncbi:TonB-dependent receptor [Flavobacterium sp. HSC-61S13]|uniref:TonB-dependent receptor n=1 Tax=Flavobacterium sp. HSC-61S13 TaxID=2910963 RepID=UPI00209EFE95|nr:TonB-dependent receptor [Flavobacterium sp. HSC-61S13]MCP1996437.1 iron complex outermembrane receptor protein [Flavobacterium sp. HSC-61S13]
MIAKSLELAAHKTGIHTKLRAFILICCAVFSHQIFAQEISLQLKNASNQPVSYANVIGNSGILATSDNAGVVLLDKGVLQNTTITISAVGYLDFKQNFPAEITQLTYVLVLKTDDTQMDEVVITAGRKAENIRTVPSSVTILNQKDIETQSSITTNLASILGNTVPGLGTSTNKATNSGQTLRGRQVLVLIDGIPQSTPLMNGARDLRTIDPNVIERIEVIKGATSIYGNGSGGGIINYITKKNRGNKVLEGATTIGTSFNPYNSAGTLGYRVAQYFSGRKDKWTYTFGGTLDYTGLQRDGEGLPVGQTDGLSNTYSNNAFVKIGYDINDNSSITALYNYYGSTQHAKYISKNGVYGQSPTIGVRGEEPGKPAGTPYNHNAMLTYTNSNLWLDTQLDATVYMNTFSSMNRYVTSGTAWYGPGQTMINSDKKGVRINLNTPFTIGNLPAEITYGLDLLNDVTYQDLVDGRVYIPKMNMVNIAPYAQLKIDFFENLIFKGGVRYENAQVKVDDFNTIATGPGNEGSIFVSGGSIPYKATVFNAGLRYNKYELFNPFVSFSQGFAINELGRILRRAKENTLGNLETDPIITNNYEIGFSSRYSIFNFSAAYYISTSDLGVNLVDVGGFLMAQREPEEVKGFELTLDAKLRSNLTIGGSYAYVEGKAKLDDGSKVYLNGSRIAPPKATGFVSYQPTDKWNLQLFWVYTGSRDRFEPNAKGIYKNSEGPISDVNLFNFAGSYTINSQWNISLGIENLFNKTYYPTVSQYRALDAEYVRGSGSLVNLNLHFKF